MANVAVVGSQWGDEGKGKIVDWLSERADVVVRFQGGHNAGHTLVIGDAVYKLSLLPSGIVRPGKVSMIGNGVVVDPWALLGEIETLRGQGIEVGPERLNIATFHLGRADVGGDALALVEIDEPLSDAVLAKVRAVPHVNQVVPLEF